MDTTFQQKINTYITKKTFFRFGDLDVKNVSSNKINKNLIFLTSTKNSLQYFHEMQRKQS